MSKPRNKTNRCRLHYLGVLAAAGLLTMGAAAPAMAADVDATGQCISNAGACLGNEIDPSTGINYTTGADATVDWHDTNIGSGGLTISRTGGGTVKVLFNAEIADGILETGGTSTINLGANNLTVTGGDISSTTGLTFAGTGDLIAGSSDLSGNYTLSDGTTTVGSIGSTAVSTIATGAAGSQLAVNGDVGGTNAVTITGAGDVTVGAGGSVLGTVALNNSGTNSVAGTVGGALATTVTVADNLTISGAVDGTTTTVTFTGGATAGLNLNGAVDGTVEIETTGTNTIGAAAVVGGTAATTLTGGTSTNAVTIDGTIGANGVTIGTAAADALTVTGASNITGNVTVNDSSSYSTTGEMSAGTFTLNASANASTIAKVTGGNLVDNSGTPGTLTATEVDGGTNTIVSTNAAIVTVTSGTLDAQGDTAITTVNGGTVKWTSATATIQAFNGGDLELVGNRTVGSIGSDGGNAYVYGDATGYTLTVANDVGADDKVTNLVIGESSSAAGDALDVAVNGNLVGTGTSGSLTVTVKDGSTLAQNVASSVSGKVTIIDNNATPDATEDVQLGVLQDGTELTYTGTASGDGMSVSDIVGDTTIINTTAGAKIEVDDTNAGVTTTFKGAGATFVNFAANNNAIVDGGKVTALSGDLDSLKIDSTNDHAGYHNNTGAIQQVGSLTGVIDGFDLNIDAGAGMTVSQNVDLSGTGGGGTLQIANGPIDLDGVTSANPTGLGTGVINVDGDLTTDFGGLSATTTETGFTNVAALNTGAAGNTILNLGQYDYLAAEMVNVKGATAFNSDFTIGAATGLGTDSGIYTGSLKVDKQMTVGGDFTVQTGYEGTATTPAITIDAAGVGDGNTAIDVAGAADIATGTYFDVTNAAVDNKITVLDASNASSQYANLEFVGGNDSFVSSGSDYVYYDTSNGSFGKFSSAMFSGAFTGQPRYATRYINALSSYNPIGSVFMGNSSNQEKTMAMGNTLNAALMLVNNPLNGIFQNNNNLHTQTESRLAKSAGDCQNFGLWITPNASFRSIDGNYGQGYGDIDIKSYGVTVGFDGWINENFRLGLFAGVNSTDLDGDFQDIDGDDFQLGVYGQAFLPQGFMLNAGLAYSWQDYDATRRVYNTLDPDFNQRIKSSFDGETIIAAIELSKTFSLDYDMFIRPAIGYTYLGTTLDSYREKSNLSIASNYNLAQDVDETDFDQHLFRVGTDIGWAVDNAAVIGRIYYVGNAGDDQPENTARFRYANAGVPSFKIYGAEYDDSMANLGLTVKVAPSDNSHFAIDYDALLGSNSTTHNVNLTFKYEW